MPFEPGNKLASGGARPGAGRKAAEDRDELKTLMDAAIPLNHRQEILEMMGTRARAGDAEAAKFVFAYRYGKPVAMPDSDLVDYVQTVMDEMLQTLDEIDPQIREQFLQRLEAKGIDP